MFSFTGEIHETRATRIKRGEETKKIQIFVPGKACMIGGDKKPSAFFCKSVPMKLELLPLSKVYDSFLDLKYYRQDIGSTSGSYS